MGEEEERRSLPSTIHVGVYFFFYWGEAERGEKNKGGEEGEINSAECLGYYPLQK